MKKYILIILILLCAVRGAADQPKKVIIRGDDSFPPYEFINDKGEPDGFNVDLTRAIMKELNLPYDLQLEEWPRVLSQLNNKEIDVITGMARFEGEESRYSLSKAHSYIDYILVYREDEPVRDATELVKKNIIVQRNSLPHKQLKSMGYNNNLTVVDNMVEGLKMLATGKKDVAICPDNMAQYIIYKSGLTNLNIVSLGWPLQEYCYVVGNPLLLEQINTGILKLKANGVYDRIHTKWLGEKRIFDVPSWIYFLLFALGLTALLLLVFVNIYKRRVRKGEILLKKENDKLNDSLLENKKWLNRYLTVFNTTLVGLSYYDKHGELVNINDEMIRLFGMDARDDVLEEHISIYQNPILRKYGIIDENNQIHEYHGVLKCDMYEDTYPGYFVHNVFPDRLLYLKMDVEPMKNSTGELEGILITAINQTAQVKHDREMAEQEAKLTLAMEAGSVAAWIYEPEKKMFVSLRGNAIAGEGLTTEENRNLLHPDDRDMQEELLSAILCGKKENADTIFRYMHEDGTYHYYESRMVGRKEEGRVVSILGTQKDITKEVLNNKMLSNTVEKLRFAIQTAGMAMWEYDCRTLVFTSYNDPIADYKDGAPISMATYDSFFQKDGTNWEQLKRATYIMKNGLDESYSFIVKLKTKYDLDWQYCTVRAVPMEKDATGKVIKYLGVRVNITDQIKYQKVLEQEREEAQQADKLKSVFLANMSHEIRTPLNAIVGFSELLQTTEEPELRKEFISIINNNNELLLRLIGDILDLSKIESGLMELKPEEFDLSGAFQEIFTALKQRCPNPEVEFLGRNPYKSCKVKLDRNRVVQVGTNFITNAIKHTTQGHILVGYEYIEGGIKIYVEDTGCGISKEKQNKLFQRFAKLDDFTQGTGLGLAICKAIVDAQGGRIGAESDEGKGSLFWAWFPCEAQIEEYEEATQLGQDSGEFPTERENTAPLEPEEKEIREKSILVAEDIDSNYMLVKAILRGCELTRAVTGKEAVDLASAHSYDAILMDMKMPVMGGIEATRKIREFDTATPIIAVTANAFDSDREEAMKAGCTAFVTKPLKKSDLRQLL